MWEIPYTARDEKPALEIDRGHLERNLQAAIDDILERYGDHGREFVAEAALKALARKRTVS